MLPGLGERGGGGGAEVMHENAPCERVAGAHETGATATDPVVALTAGFCLSKGGASPFMIGDLPLSCAGELNAGLTVLGLGTCLCAPGSGDACDNDRL